MPNFSKRSPKWIDTKIAEISAAREPLARSVGRALKFCNETQVQAEYSAAEKYSPSHRRVESAYYVDRNVKHSADQLASTRRALAAFDAEHSATFEECQAQYRARRWSRFFLVTSSDGHVHSSMHCGTCRWSTTYGWLPVLSGQSEKKMVATHGENACTVCFPSAPTLPGWGQLAEAEAAKFCPLSKTYAKREHTEYTCKDGRKAWRTSLACPECGQHQSLTSTGKYRRHARPC